MSSIPTTRRSSSPRPGRFFRAGRVRALALCVLLWGGCAADPPEAADPVSGDAAVSNDASSGALTVRDPWARSAPEGGTSAVYFDLLNGTAEPDTLVAIHGVIAGRTELHETYDHDGMRGMRPATGVPLPAGGSATLTPGSYHVMLIGLSRALQPGDTLTLELTFARASPMNLRVPVRGLDGLD